MAFYDTLPPESATYSKANSLTSGVDLDVMMLAKIHDAIVTSMYSAANKKVKKEVLIAGSLVKKDSRESRLEKNREFFSKMTPKDFAKLRS